MNYFLLLNQSHIKKIKHHSVLSSQQYVFE